MKRALLALLFALGVACPAFAVTENCTFAAGYTSWTSVAQNIDAGACTEDSADHFIVNNATSIVRVSASLTLASPGDFRCTAGTVIFEPGFVFAGGDQFYFDNACTVISQPQVKLKARATAISRGAASTAVLTFQTNTDLTTRVVAGDSIRFTYDDFPSDASASLDRALRPQAFPAFPAPGEQHLGMSAGRIYRVTARTANTITYETNPNTDYAAFQAGGNLGSGFCTGAAAPQGCCTGSHAGTCAESYIGTYGGLGTAILITSNTRLPYGDTSLLVTTASASAFDGDFGSQVIEWIAGPCAGTSPAGNKRAKIVGFQNNGITDRIFVAGDTSACGTSNVIRTMGESVGDMVEVYSVAVLDGAETAHVIFKGGNYAVGALKIVRPDNANPAAGGDLGPLGAFTDACAICWVQLTSADVPTGYMWNVESAYFRPTTAGNGETYINYWTGLRANPNFQLAIRSDGLASDYTQISYRGWYCHDDAWYRDATNLNGTHCFVNYGGRVAWTEFLAERMSDDGFLFIRTSSSLTLGSRPSLTIRRGQSYESLALGAAGANQNGFDMGGYGFGEGANSSYVLAQGAADVSDFVGFGFWNSTVDGAAGIGDKFSRIMVGNQAIDTNGEPTFDLGRLQTATFNWNGCMSAGVPSACCDAANTDNAAPFCYIADDAFATYQSQLSDSVVWPIRTGASSNLLVLGWKVTGSIVPVVSNSSAYAIGGPVVDASNFFTSSMQTISDVFPYAVDNSVCGVSINGGASGGVGHCARIGDTKVSTDSVWIDRIANNTRYGEQYYAQTPAGSGSEMTKATFLRVFFGVDHVWTGAGFLDAFGRTPAKIYMDHVALTQNAATATADGLGDGTSGDPQNDGANTTHACIETLGTGNPLTASTGFGATKTATAQQFTVLGPDVSDDVTFRAFQQRVAGALCDPPANYGLQSIGMSAAMMGDFLIPQIQNFSTRDDLISRSSGNVRGVRR